MRLTELLRLVWLNINQNRFKSIMTSIGIVVGAATIVMVIGIGRGGQMDIADQFAELNAGAIDISYNYEGEEEITGNKFSFGNAGGFFGNMMGGMPGGRANSGRSNAAPDGSNVVPNPGNTAPGAGNVTPDGSNAVPNPGNAMPGAGNAVPDTGGAVPGENSFQKFGNGEEKMKTQDQEEENPETESEETTSLVDDRLNQEQIILSVDDVEDIETYVTGISGVSISYSTKSSVEGGNLTSAQTYTVAGVMESFEKTGKLELGKGDFISESDDESKSRVCVLGSETAKQLFGSEEDALNGTIYIDDRTYTVIGVLSSSNTVISGISPDSTIFVPYQTGIKYLTGEDIDPTITVIAEDVNTLQSVISNVKTVLKENYPNASFSFEDSGSKMKAAEASNHTLTMLLSAMAAIVFFVGGIGIMNVLFVSVKERTNEIGILKAIGTPRSNILLEFLVESAAISLIGGILGVALSFGIMPVIRYFDIRVEVNLAACVAALGFAVLTGTIFGIYPAWKASRLEPVDALNAE